MTVLADSWFHRYVFADAWVPTWPNLLAWVVCGALAASWAARKFLRWDRLRRLHDAQRHAELRAHLLHLKAHVGASADLPVDLTPDHMRVP